MDQRARLGRPRPRSVGGRPQYRPAGWLTLGGIAKAAGAYGLLLLCSYALSPAEWTCPKDLSCENGRPGSFWDARGTHGSSSAARAGGAQKRAGHLMEREMGLGLLASDSCSKMCQDVPDCAFWMYSKNKKTGSCKLWAVDQDPCKPTSSFLFPFSTVRFSRRGSKGGPAHQKEAVVGGPCRREAEGDASVLEEGDRDRKLAGDSAGDVNLGNLNTEECPHLECAAPDYGFLFDHKDKGHLKTVRMQQDQRRGLDCYHLCRETPGCSLWMVDETATDGDCKMWTKEQSPCEPTDPYDASTAHFVKNVPGHEFLIGGNCHKLKPRPSKRQAGHTSFKKLVT